MRPTMLKRKLTKKQLNSNCRLCSDRQNDQLQNKQIQKINIKWI